MKVDCIIPLYNKKNFIINSINSALNQKNSKFENIIVINDGSTDGGELIVENLAKKHDSVKLINQNNFGSSAARNKGVEKSSSEFVVFLDADDQLHEKYLLCLKLMEKKFPKHKVYSTKHYNVFNNLELIRNSKGIKLFKSKINKLENPILNYSFNPKIFCSSGICIKRELIYNIKFPEGINVGEDIYTWLKIFEKNNLVLYDKELVIIRKVSENRSINIFKEIPYYLKKINVFNINKKKSYLVYFLIASIIYFYQKRNDKNITKKFLEIIKNQSKFIYSILLIFNNFLLFRFYQILKNKKDKEENNRKNLKIENFFLLSINYFFVLPGIPIIILCLYVSENYNLISDILLMSSITIFITSSISFYARPFVLISNRFKDALRFLKIKKILIFPILIILFLAKHLLVLEGFIVINISIFFLLYLWRNEANMAILEFESSKNKLFYNLLEVVSIKSLLIINIFFQNFTLEIITLIILIVLLVYRNTEIYKIKDINQTFGYFKKFVDQNLFYVFLNSFILNLTNFFHRYLILIFADKTYAGILFFAFSMGSFPANLFSFVLSSTIIRSKNPLPTFGIISFFIYFILSIYIICLNIFNVDSSIIYYIFEKQHLEFIFYSMLGGMLMSYALFQKNKILLIKNSMKKIFIPEFIYSLIILALIPYIYYYFSIENFKFIFLLNSIFAFIIFIPMHKFLKNE